MRLSDDQIRSRLSRAEFGVLGTVDADRGVHLVPVVFLLDGDRLLIPIDTVKAKSTTRLRRLRNLEQDIRASLLVDHRSEDWSELWWARADLVFVSNAVRTEADAGALRSKYPTYASPGSIDTVLNFEVVNLAGWVAEPGSSPGR
ncbi:MAG: pyridoxamine 5'-phosphate oxidase family protein [Acidimicrobiia bacterium]|nr:pyridoxamine 5'-phosphate oxidase family protein [Acidimicrobiia bacterium]